VFRIKDCRLRLRETSNVVTCLSSFGTSVQTDAAAASCSMIKRTCVDYGLIRLRTQRKWWTVRGIKKTCTI